MVTSVIACGQHPRRDGRLEHDERLRQHQRAQRGRVEQPGVVLERHHDGEHGAQGEGEGERRAPAALHAVEQRPDHRRDHGERRRGDREVERDVGDALGPGRGEEQRVGQRDGDRRVDRVGHHRGVGEGGEARSGRRRRRWRRGGTPAPSLRRTACSRMAATRVTVILRGSLRPAAGRGVLAPAVAAWRPGWCGSGSGWAGGRSAPAGRPAWLRVCSPRGGVGVGAAGPTRVVGSAAGRAVVPAVCGARSVARCGRGPGSGRVDAGVRRAGPGPGEARERRRRGRRRPLPRWTAVGAGS